VAGRIHIERERPLAACRRRDTLDQAIGKVGPTYCKNPQGARYLLCAVDDNLLGAQQDTQRLLDLVIGKFVAGSQHPIKFDDCNQADEARAFLGEGLDQFPGLGGLAGIITLPDTMCDPAKMRISSSIMSQAMASAASDSGKKIRLPKKVANS